MQTFESWMTMEVNLFSEKSVRDLLATAAILFASSALGSERNNAKQIMEEVLSQKFVEIVNQEIQPTMPPIFRGAVDDLIDSTVAVIGSNEGMGSGVLLSDKEKSRLGLVEKFGEGHFVATVEHVIAEDQEYAVVFYDPTVPELNENAVELAQVVGSNRAKDLALLKINRKPNNSAGSNLVTKSDSISIGDDVQAVGHPNEMWWTYTRGYVSQFRNEYSWYYVGDKDFTLIADVIQTQTPITTGNSGGPLFTKNGKILGLNAFGDPEFQSINFAVSFDEIENFILGLSTNVSFDLTINDIILPSLDVWVKLDELDFNNDGYVDAIVYDTNNDGKADLGEFDTDFDGKTDHFEYDVFNDLQFAQTYYPPTSEYYAEWRIDTDGDGKADLAAADKNDDGIPDFLEEI